MKNPILSFVETGLACDSCNKASSDSDCALAEEQCPARQMCYAHICTGGGGFRINKGCDDVCAGRANGEMWCERHCTHCYHCCDVDSFCNANTTLLVSFKGTRDQIGVYFYSILMVPISEKKTKCRKRFKFTNHLWRLLFSQCFESTSGLNLTFLNKPNLRLFHSWNV